MDLLVCADRFVELVLDRDEIVKDEMFELGVSSSGPDMPVSLLEPRDGGTVSCLSSF